MPEVTRSEVDHGRGEIGHHGGQDYGADLTRRKAALGAQSQELHRPLVGRAVGLRGEAPIGQQSGAVEGREHGVGIADVDGQQDLAHNTRIPHLPWWLGQLARV